MTNKEYRFELHPARLRSGKDGFVLWQATGQSCQYRTARSLGGEEKR